MRNQLEFSEVSFRNVTHENILILDTLRTPGNIGMLLRSAVAFGFKKVINISEQADLISVRVKKSARSAFNHIEIIQKQDIVSEILDLKEEGYTIIGIELTNDSIPINEYTPDVKTKYAFILGNERNGINCEALRQCDLCLHIKINPALSSINVANAGAIAMYQFFSHIF